MNYYERHLGDYAKDTAHLTMLEHGAYTLLLDRYYSTEAGIPADQAHRVARARTRDEKAAVDTVLGEFFALVDGMWVNGRAQEEIEKAQSRIKAAKENGKRGGRPKKNPAQPEEKPAGFSLGSEMETQPKAHHVPDTKHQIPNETPLSDSQANAPSKAARKRRLPDDFELTFERAKRATDYWQDRGRIDLSTRDEFQKFTAHHRSRGTTMLDWDAAWQTWYSNAIKFNALAGASHGARQRTAPVAIDHNDTSWADSLGEIL